jgi:hypothetical protein
MKFSRSAVAVCAAFLMALSSGTAFGGEVKGPPTPVGTPNTNLNLAARFHANSVCAFSGLNDRQPGQGQVTEQTQTPADFAPGSAGHGLDGVFPIGCKGGSNPYNPPS